MEQNIKGKQFHMISEEEAQRLIQIYYHPLIWIAALWAITFSGATITLARIFKKNVKVTKDQEPDMAHM